LDNSNLDNKTIFKNSVKKAIEILPINKEKKGLIKEKIFHLIKNNNLNDKQVDDFNYLNISEIFINNSDLHKNHNFPILDALKIN